ncbi:MAG: YicC family protein [Planctomycetota bacterium]|nr:YicC family protein [Planctomycetota bacterium]
MTGYGEATQECDGVRVKVELRAINNRYLRISMRCDKYLAFESRAEELVRKLVHRGTVNGTIHIARTNNGNRYRIDDQVVRAYLQQIQELPAGFAKSDSLNLGVLLQLPGAVQERETEDGGNQADLAAIVDTAVQDCLSRLTVMRETEGRAMQVSLEANLVELTEHWQAVNERAPSVAENYRQRLHDRINQLLQEHGITLLASDLVREVGMYGERCDISEELVRLQSHVQQFRTTIQQPESNGRKLDFVIQEMVRETNTMGAKANDPELAHHVVEMKSIIDRMREMVQNVE